MMSQAQNRESNLYCHCSQPALQICVCDKSLSYYCGQHIEEHSQKPAATEHKMYPIEAYQMLSTLGITEFQSRLDRIETVFQQLQLRFYELDNVKAKIETRFNEFIGIVEDRKRSKLQEIEQFKEDVQEEMRKFRAHTADLQYSSEYQPVNSLEKLACDHDSLDRLELIDDPKLLVSDEKPNVLTFTTELRFNRGLFALAEGRPFLPILKGNSLFKLDLEGRTATSAIRLDCSNSFEECQTCFLDQEQHLFVCGGRHTNTAAFEITLATGNVRRHKKDMEYRRENGHGVISVPPFVYVFGGTYRSDILDAAERFDRTQLRWERLTPMKAKRSDFTPCLYTNAVYLIGGHSHLIEKFDIASKTYLKIDSYIESGGPCLSFPIGNSFLIMNGSKLFKADAQKMKIIELADRDQSAPTSVIAPFNRSNVWYFTDFDHNQCITLWKYDTRLSQVMSVDYADLR